MVHTFQKSLFLSVSCLALCTIAGAQSAADIQAQVEAHLGQPFGILGPLPLSAETVSVAAKGSDFAVLLKDLSYGSVDLGALEFTMSPLEEGVMSVDGVSFSGGEAYSFDEWSWTGTWDMGTQSYRDINYSAQNLAITAEELEHRVGSFELMAGGQGTSYYWNLNFSDYASVDKSGAEDGFAFTIDSFTSSTTSSGDVALDEYGQLAQLMGGMGVLQGAGADAVRSPGSMVRALPDLFATGEGLMAEQLSNVTSADASIEMAGISLFVPQADAKVTVDSLKFTSQTIPNADGSLSMDSALVGQGLDISRREDTASIASGRLDISLHEFDLNAFYDAARSLFGEPQPGDTWAFLFDLIAFYSDFSISASVSDADFAMPDRQVAVSLDSGVGAFALDDMKVDGASMSLIGNWQGLDVTSTGEVPEGVTPEPLVFYGRVLRFDPLTTAIIPREVSGVFELGNLPLGQVRQTLSFQPHAAPLYDTGAVAREAMTAGLVLMTPFLITPPVAKLKDVSVTGDGYSMSVEAEHNINPVIRPLFGTGSANIQFDGVEKLTGIADGILAEQEGLGEDERDEDLVEWATRIKDTWIGRLVRFASEGDSDPYDYDIQASQLGQVTVNGEVVFDATAQ